MNRTLKPIIFQRRAKLNESGIECVRNGGGSILNQDFGLTLGALNSLDITFDLVHSDLICLFNAVPDAQITTVLSHNYVRVRNPVDEFAVVQQRLLALLLDVIEMQLATLVSEKKLGASWVELKVVNLAIVIDRRLQLVVLELQIQDADGHAID